MNDTAVLYCTAWPRTASTAPQIRISSVALVQNTGDALSETACIAENGARQIKSKFFEEKKNWRGAGKGMRGREMIRRMRQLVSGQSESSLHGIHPTPSRWLMRIRWIMDHHPLARITFYLHRARTSLALLLSHNKAFLTRGRFIGNGMKPKPKKKKNASRTPPFFFFLFVKTSNRPMDCRALTSSFLPHSRRQRGV